MYVMVFEGQSFLKQFIHNNQLNKLEAGVSMAHTKMSDTPLIIIEKGTIFFSYVSLIKAWPMYKNFPFSHLTITWLHLRIDTNLLLSTLSYRLMLRLVDQEQGDQPMCGYHQLFLYVYRLTQNCSMNIHSYYLSSLMKQSTL